MSRYFAIQTWVSSHDNEPDYNGQQTGSRHVRSVEIPMFTQHGKANVDWFSDEAIAARTAKKAPTVSIKDKILPQFRRLNTLQSQMVELEQSYKAGEMSISEYSLLRDCLVAKKERAEVLYRKAISVKPKSYDDEDSDLYDETPQDSVETTYKTSSTLSDNTRTGGVASASWIDEISDRNSFKKILQITCKVVRTGLYYKHKISSYLNELKAI